ncbi:unnamed protein product [Trichogramma brassicae]|uniref:BZIP domain-containing protein n=1 Tax=Trichogramma brassicae TaxID=86971 RepID=A0A6H5IB36_9HYME|nr:unnamed protein product [Trichogramma brassicae]
MLFFLHPQLVRSGEFTFERRTYSFLRMDSSKKSPVMAVSASSSHVPAIGSSAFGASCASSALALFPNLHLPLWTLHAADPVDLSHRHHPPSPPTSSAYTNYVSGLPPGSSSMQAVPSLGRYSPPSSCSPPHHPTNYPGNWSPGSSGSRSPPPYYAPPPPHWPPVSFLDSPKFRPSMISVVDDARKYRSHSHSYHPYAPPMGSSSYASGPMQNFYAAQVNSDSVTFPRFSFSSKPAVTKPLASTAAAAAAAAAVPSTNATASSPQVRPFKAIAKDPMSLMMSSNLLFDQHTHREFMEFREKSLAKIKRTGDNSKMSRSGSSSSSNNSGDNNNNSQSAEVTSNNEGNKIEERDPTYREKRKKNNEAAKKSRDARKMREDELAIWAEFMKLQNVRLMNRVAFLEETLGQMQMTVQQQAQHLLRLQRRASPDRVKSSSTPIAPVA